MRARLFVLLFAVAACLSGFLGVGQQDAVAAENGKPERISVAYCTDCVQFHFQNSDGKAAGLIIDMWRLWSERTGIAVDFKPASWEKTLKMVGDGRADAHAGLFFNDERAKFLDYGVPLTKTDTQFFVHKDLPGIESVEDLTAYKVGVLSGDYVEGFLKEKLPPENIVGFVSYEAIMEALSEGSLQVFAADTPTAIFHLQKAGLSFVFEAPAEKPLYSSDWFVAVTKGNTDLIGTINAGMALISVAEFRQIERRWASISDPKIAGNGHAAQRLTLTDQERQWITDHPVIRVHNEMDWPPFNFFEDGKPQGLSVEYFNLLASTIGVQVEYVTGPSWNEFLGMMKSGGLDVMLNIVKTPERQKYLLYTKPYSYNPNSILSHTDHAYNSLEELFGKTIAIPKGFFYEEILKRDYPQIKLHLVKNTQESMKAVSFGKADAAFGELAVFNYLLNREMMTGLILSGEVKLGESSYSQLNIAVRKDTPTLIEILRKGMEALDTREVEALKTRWLNIGKAQDEPRKSIDLTAEEAAWIKSHPVLEMGALTDWPPFDYQDEDGRHAGIAAELVQLLAERVGLDLNIRFDEWSVTLGKIKAGELDLVASIYKTPEREPFLEFSEPYLELYDAIFTTESTNDVTSAADLKGRTVALEKGFYTHDLLKRAYPEINILTVSNTLEALKAVSAGKADAYIGTQYVASHHIKKYVIPNLKTVGFLGNKPNKIYLATPKSIPILRGILDKALASVTENEKQSILRKFIVLGGDEKEKRNQLKLSTKERRWLSQHKTIRLGVDPLYPPFEFVDEKGMYSGMASDYVRLISERLGITMEVVEGLSWEQVLEGVKDGSIDVLPAATMSPERQSFLNFSTPHMAFPIIIVTRENYSFVAGLDDLNGTTIAQTKGYAVTSHVEVNYPEIKRHLVDDPLQALRAVSVGEVEATVMNLAVASHLIRKHNLTNLKVAAPAEIDLPGLSFGVRKDWPQLVGILDKALASITPEEESAIRSKWVSVQYKTGIDMSRVLQGGGVAAIIVIIIMVWNRRLQNEVRRRKQGEADLAVAKNEAESANRAKSAFLAAMSHEIRTPMNGVVGMIDLLRESDMNREQHHMTETVRDSAFALLQIIDDILDFSKIEAGKMDMESIPISIRDIIEGVSETLTPNTDTKGIQLFSYIDPNIPDWVLGDQVRVRQILFNLSGNAIKFTAGGPEHSGRVDIRADRIPSSDSNEKVEVRFTVKDTGIGMTKEAIDSLFKPFTQVESSTTRRYGGTGLGLTICKNLVEIMGGCIEVDSKPDVGSTFAVNLAFDRDGETPVRYDEPDLSGLRTLISVRYDGCLEIVRKYLEHKGCEVEEVDGLEEIEPALLAAASSKKPFDFIVTGSLWDAEDRDQVIDTIRGNLDIPNIRFVVLSADRVARKGMVLPDTVLLDGMPLQRSSFLHGAAMAVGRASPNIESEMEKISDGVSKAPTVEDAAAIGELILLAEDNLTNQDVIMSQLDMLGYAAELAEDGREALEMWNSDRHGLILTDCHMPEMDGFEFTGAVRKQECTTGKRVPIIAITANALVGEADRCLAAGMDDYLAKPVTLNHLKRALHKWIPDTGGTVEAREQSTSGAASDSPQSAQLGDELIDRSALERLVGDNPDLHLTLLKKFIDPAKDIAEQFEEAFKNRDTQTVGELAHKLKSSARAIGANELADTCQELETAGRVGEWKTIEELGPKLGGMVRNVEGYVNAL